MRLHRLQNQHGQDQGDHEEVQEAAAQPVRAAAPAAGAAVAAAAIGLGLRRALALPPPAPGSAPASPAVVIVKFCSPSLRAHRSAPGPDLRAAGGGGWGKGWKLNPS